MDTIDLIMAFSKNVGRGFGAAWRGIIFQSASASVEKIAGATFDHARMIYEWPTGETLRLTHSTNYYEFHGHEFPFIGWADGASGGNELRESMMACHRSWPGVPTEAHGVATI